METSNNKEKWTFKDQTTRVPQPAFDRRAITILVCIVGFIIFVSKMYKQPDVPDALRGRLTASGLIQSCEMSSLGSDDERYYIGITLNTQDVPLLGDNPLVSDRVRYFELCESKAAVAVQYHAEKRPDGAVVFWIDKISPQ